MFPLFVVRFFVRAASGAEPLSGFFAPAARAASLRKAGFDPKPSFRCWQSRPSRCCLRAGSPPLRPNSMATLEYRRRKRNNERSAHLMDRRVVASLFAEKEPRQRRRGHQQAVSDQKSAHRCGSPSQYKQMVPSTVSSNVGPAPVMMPSARKRPETSLPAEPTILKSSVSVTGELVGMTRK